MAASDLERVERLQGYLREMTDGLGRVERRDALKHYLRGLLLAGERKSIQPIAERIAPSASEVEAYRQRMQEALVIAQWDEEVVYRRIAKRFLEVVSDVDALVIDDTGFPKKGKHSPCVQRQYSGTLGRVDNCQVAVSLHLASDTAGACIGMRLFLPKSWEGDEGRRKKCKLPEGLQHEEKWRVALRLLDERKECELQGKIVLADAGYGDARLFREGLQERGFNYLVGVGPNTTLWADGNLPSPPEERDPEDHRPGRRHTRWSRDVPSEKAIDIARRAKPSEWNWYEWSNGTQSPRAGRFLCKRVRLAQRASHGNPPGEELWLLIQWNDDQEEPSNYWLCSLPQDEETGRLVYLAKLRWRIERDYQEMKGELGLDHYEGRTWDGFHHHCVMVAAAHAFLALERALFPPTGTNPAALSTDSTNGPSR